MKNAVIVVSGENSGCGGGHKMKRSSLVLAEVNEKNIEGRQQSQLLGLGCSRVF